MRFTFYASKETILIKVNVGDRFNSKKRCFRFYEKRVLKLQQFWRYQLKTRDFIDSKRPTDDPAGNDIPVPGGTYMKLNNM